MYGAANGSRQRWQDRRPSSAQAQSLDPLQRAGQHLPQLARIGQLGQVAGAAGDEVVQEEGVAVVEQRVLDEGDVEVVGRAAVVLAQPEQDGGGEAGHGEHVVAERDALRQGEHDALGGELAGEQHGAGVLLVAVAVLAPGPVLVALVGQPGAVEVAAGLADPEPGPGEPVAGDGDLAGGVAAGAEVVPAHVHALEVRHPQPAGGVPAVLDGLRVDVGGGDDGEPGADALVVGVVDAGLVAPHERGDAGELDGLEPLADVVDAGLPAAGAGGGGVVAVVAVAAVGAEPHGADGGAVVAHLDGVDVDLVAADVERRAGREVAQGVGAGAGVVGGLGVVLAGVGVDPAHGDVELDGVVDQRVVGQQPDPLERGDPEVAVGGADLGLQHALLGAGLLERAGVVVAVLLAGLEVGQFGDELVEAVLEVLLLGVPALGGAADGGHQPAGAVGPGGGPLHAAPRRRRGGGWR